MQHKHKQDVAKPTRREFAKALAALAAAPLVVDTGPVSAQEDRPVTPEDALNATAKNLSKIADIRYGKYLTDKQRKRVQRSITSQLRSAERLKKFKLSSGDEPAFVFRADGP
jgi:hypothetical protein